MTGELNPAQRAASLDAATAGEHDLVVVGGGVTGTGAAVDAALRGLSVVLVEAGDLAAGTSSRSGKTIHGGLRYLEQLNFKLVRSALRERDLISGVLAPHLTTPESFLYPLTHHWERPYVGAGIALYDVMGGRRTEIPHHRHYTRTGALRLAPALDPSTITGAIRYYDVLIDDARHTMTLARTAASLGAHILTRTPVVDILVTDDRVGGVVIEDKATGDRHEIRARAVINAAGTWSARIQQLAGAPTFGVRPAKGVHLVVPRSAVDSETGILARAEDSVLVLRNWQDHWLIGTTDTPWDASLGAPVATDEDISYLLDNSNRYLRRKLTRSDVVGVYAGVRPLLAPAGGASSATTSALSRDHSVIEGPAGLVTIVGGKYTTYRLMAADAVDAAARRLDRPVPASTTATRPLLGAAGWRDGRAAAVARAARYGIDASRVDRMRGRYGDRIGDVLDILDRAPELNRPVAGMDTHLAVEIVHAATAEGAMTVQDVLERRTHGAIETADAGATAAPDVARLLAGPLGWDEREQNEQVRAYTAAVRKERVAL